MKFIVCFLIAAFFYSSAHSIELSHSLESKISSEGQKLSPEIKCHDIKSKEKFVLKSTSSIQVVDRGHYQYDAIFYDIKFFDSKNQEKDILHVGLGSDTILIVVSKGGNEITGYLIYPINKDVALNNTAEMVVRHFKEPSPAEPYEYIDSMYEYGSTCEFM